MPNRGKVELEGEMGPCLKPLKNTQKISVAECVTSIEKYYLEELPFICFKTYYSTFLSEKTF